MPISKFSPISVQGKTFSNPYSRRQRHPFNDKRSSAVHEKAVDQMSKQQTTIIQQMADTASQADQFYHFFNNDRVSVEELISESLIREEVVEGQSVLILGDTSSVNLVKGKGRIEDIERAGVLNDGKTPGFHTHVHLALNEQGEVLGLADILYWSRQPANKKTKKAASSNKSRKWEEKESVRWAIGAFNASKAIQGATRRTFILDQEADSFDLMKYLQTELEDDLIIRANHNRVVEWQGEQMTLNECLAQSQSKGSYQIDLPKLDHYSWTSGKRIKRTARKATMELKTERVGVYPPKKSGQKDPIWLNVVHVKEVGDSIPKGESPIEWTIWTTRSTSSFEQAKHIVRLYLFRWTIEQFFRTLKKKGLNIEATQLESFDAILRQTTMAMKAACTVLQLTYARNRMDCQPTSDVFTQDEQQVLQKVNEHLQGKTEKQKNPFPKKKLSWAAWIIGRLGGWKGYQSQSPPGPITMIRGLEKFYVYVNAFELFNDT